MNNTEALMELVKPICKLIEKSGTPHTKVVITSSNVRVTEEDVHVMGNFSEKLKNVFLEECPNGTYGKIETNGIFENRQVQMYFVLHYPDWCKFEKSTLYSSLVSYLSEV